MRTTIILEKKSSPDQQLLTLILIQELYYMTRWGSFNSSDAMYKRVDSRVRRYEMGLNTWSDWLEFNINRTKTKLFFMSLSPFHT